jgi:hypothetical protein
LDALGEHLDVLASDLHVPLTSRRTWLSAWIASYPEYDPWAVVVRDGTAMVGACLLARRRVGSSIAVVPIGHGRNDRTRLLALDEDAAQRIADRVVEGLCAMQGPWTLSVEQLSPGDLIACAITQRLPGSRVVPGGSVPGVAFVEEQRLESHLSNNLRRQLQKCRNRIASDGVSSHIAFTREPSEVLRLLGDVEHVHRARDHEVGRSSDIDDSAGLHLWRGVITGHAQRGAVELATLHLDGTLAAYVVSFVDDETYRVFDGRFLTKWERYSPGRLLETETLGHAMSDGRFSRLDWMNSIAPEKLISANSVEATVNLVGSSAPVAHGTASCSDRPMAISG